MIWACIVVGVLLLLYLLFFLENRRFATTFTTYESKKIETPFRIVQVSDLHDRSFGKEQVDLMYAIRQAKPDCIVITGDLFNRHNPYAYHNAFVFAKKVKSVAPTYFIEGNHEFSLKQTGERFMEQVAEEGICVLRDAFTELPQCRLIGLRQRAPAETLSAMLADDRLNVVLAHRPERFAIYAQTQADVMLSGHAHGGQIRFGHRGVYAPQQGFFPKYTEGWYRIGNSSMYVSRGLGNTIAFPRVFNTPELNVIDFLPVQSKED
ncbi:MAG: metallophosphoesterase [Clostridia bacterium]|nr:metallophosphoesterase [Clostridia bacterium]